MLWTVEWVIDGERDLVQDCDGADSLTALFAATKTGKTEARRAKKRKREGSIAAGSVPATVGPPNDDAGAAPSVKHPTSPNSSGTVTSDALHDHASPSTAHQSPEARSKVTSERHLPNPLTAAPDFAGSQVEEGITDVDIVPGTINGRHFKEAASSVEASSKNPNVAQAVVSVNDHADDSVEHAGSDAHGLAISTAAPDVQATAVDTLRSSEAILPEKTHSESLSDGGQVARHFYLFRPATASASKVLIPLNADATLTQSLKDQHLQEYPTLYVLPTAPEALSTEYTLYEVYAREPRREDTEMERLQRSSGGESSGHSVNAKQHEAGDSTPLDAQSILNMLKRDTRT